MEYKTFLTEDFKMARIVRHRAKSDKYCVGAVLKCKNGNKYVGCNIEHPSHAPIYAEIVAFTKALSEGEQCFERLVVVGGDNDTDNFSKYLPCKDVIEFIQAYVEKDFKIYNIYEYVMGNPCVEEYTIEDLSFVNDYCLKVTEQYFRNYYSAKSKVIKTEITYYNIEKELELPTMVSFIKIKDFFHIEDAIWSVSVEFINEQLEYEIVEINLDMQRTIVLTEGNRDVSRTSVCVLELVKK